MLDAASRLDAAFSVSGEVSPWQHTHMCICIHIYIYIHRCVFLYIYVYFSKFHKVGPGPLFCQRVDPCCRNCTLAKQMKEGPGIVQYTVLSSLVRHPLHRYEFSPPKFLFQNFQILHNILRNLKNCWGGAISTRMQITGKRIEPVGNHVQIVGNCCNHF